MTQTVLIIQPGRQNSPAHHLCTAPNCTQAATWAWAGKVPRPRAPAWAAKRPDQSRPSARIVGSKPATVAAPLNPSAIRPSPLSVFAALFLSFLSAATAAPSDSSGESVEPWRRRQPPRRCARSPAGERIAVERPGRGAPVAGSRRAVPPRPALSFPHAPHVHDGEVSHPFPLFPFRFLWFLCSDFIRFGD